MLYLSIVYAGELTPALTADDLDEVQCQTFDGARPLGPVPAATLQALLGLHAGATSYEFGGLAGKDRHFRAAFKHPVTIGTLYTTQSGALTAVAKYQHGVGLSISYLKPTAVYPGDVTEEDQWVRIPDVGVLRTLPPGVQTRALRISDRYLQPQTFPSHVSRLLLFQERYYSALNLGQCKLSTREGKPEVWLGVWHAPLTIAAILADPLNAASVGVEELKPDVTEPAALAPPERWKHQKDFISTRGGVSLYTVEKPFASSALRLSAGPRGTSSQYGQILPLVNLGDTPVVPSLQAPPPPVSISYDMPMDGFVAVQISDKQTGKLVRRLVAEVARDKGPVEEVWDLKDDNGQLVPPGEYLWKALARPPFKLTYEMSVNNAGQPAWWAPPPGKGGGGWLADHTPPSSTCAVGNLVFLGAPCAESGNSSIAVDLEGNKVWGATVAGFSGTERLASDGRYAYLIHTEYVKQVDPQNDFALRHLLTPHFPRDLPGAPISGAAGRGNKLYLAYNARNPSWLAPSFTANDLDPSNSMPRVWLRKGNGGRSGRGDKNYEESEYDELMQYYAAFLVDFMPDVTPSLAGSPVPSSTSAFFGDAPLNGPYGGMVTSIFKKPVTIGSIMIPNAAIKVYALKLEAKIPGDVPGENGPDDPEGGAGDTEKYNPDDWLQLTVTGKAGQPGIALAPEGGLKTQALRFTTTRLIWCLAMGRRFADCAPQAERIIEEGKLTAHGGWAIERPVTAPITPYTPAMMALQWPEAVQLRGISLTYPIASTTMVDYWIGPAGKDPKSALHDDTCWKEAGIIQPVQFSWSCHLGTTRSVDFGAIITTRGVRIRALEPEGYRAPPYGVRPVAGPHKGGFDAIVAYVSLGADPVMPTQIGPRITEYRIPPPDEKDSQLTIIRHLPMVAPGNIAFAKDGTLYAFSDGQIVTVPLVGDPVQKVVVKRDQFAIPGDLTVDADGLLYATDLGTKNIKVFNPKTGALERTIGKAGGQRVGPWDPERLDNPLGITVDAAGKLWVADCTYQPKRIQRYSRDGKVEKWFLGPTAYGGGGWLDSGDTSIVNYNGMKFIIDWKTREWKLASILYRPGAKESSGGAMPDRVVYLKGRRYLVGPDNYAGLATICTERNNIAVPMAAAGPLSDWADIRIRPDLLEKFGALSSQTNDFLWWDKNSDGIPQADEVAILPALGTAAVGEDLSFNFDNLRLRPTGFLPSGVPQYDAAAMETVPGGAAGKWETADGRTFVKGIPNRLYAADGKTVLWEYPNQFNHHDGYYASNFGYNRPPGVLNQEHALIGHFSLNNAQDKPEEYFFTNSDAGDWFCYSGDGLLVGCILGGPAGYGLRQWTMPEWEPGKTDLSDLRAGQEHYHGCVVKADNGSVYAVTGHNHVSVVRVDGLAQVQRMTGLRTITAEDIAKTQAWEVVKAEHDRLRQEPKVAKMPYLANPIHPSGGLENWPEELFLTIHDYWQHSLIGAKYIVHAQAALACDNTNLYIVGWSLDGTMRNTATDPKLLFKHGAALDVTLGMNPKADAKRTAPVAGDLRILLSQVKGEAVAVLYRPVAIDAPVDKHYNFTSPVGENRMDLVDVIADAEVSVTQEAGRWIIEAVIPWASLGVKPPAVGTHLRGDVGILQSDQNGVRTVNRLYWSGKSQTIISDLPSEARLIPALWGEFYVTDPEGGEKFGPADVTLE